MQGVADYMAAKGEEYNCIPALRLLSKAREMQKDQDPTELITSYCTLGSQLLQLGYSGKAGLAFAKVETLINNKRTSTEAKLRWHTGYAEYLLQIGNLAKCESTLQAAEVLAREDQQFMSLARSSTTLSGRIRFNRILADACYVYSLLTLRTGYQKDAARYAKQSVALNRRIWAALESKIAAKKATQPVDTDTDMADTSQTAFDPLSSMRNDKGVPLVMSVTHASLNGPELWTLVPRLHRSLMQQSRVFAHQGLLHEAVYVAEQADKVASATASRSLVLENSSCRAEYWALSGRADKAQSAIGSITLSEPYNYLSMAAYHSSVARIHHSNKEYEDEIATYERLEQVLNELTAPSFIKKMDRFSLNVEDLAEQVSAMTLDKPEPKKKPPTKGARGRKPAPKVAPRTTTKSIQKVVKPATVVTTSISTECFSLQSLQAEIILRRALTSLGQEDVPGSLELLQQAESFVHAQDKHVQQLWVGFKTALSQCFQALANDFTFNTLPESTIAFPSINRVERGTPEQPASKSGAKPPARGGEGKKEMKQDFIKILCEGREKLKESYNLCLQSSSNHSFYQAALALGQVTVLLSAVAGDESQGSLHPLYAAHMSGTYQSELSVEPTNDA
jgi:separase